MAEAFYIGMDLCSDFTQLSYYNDITREPESISQLNNKETYMMPNILFYSRETGYWYVGGEASEARFKEDGIILDELYKNANGNEVVQVDGTQYTYKELFHKMVKYHIESFIHRYEGSIIKKLVITVPEYNKELFSSLSDIYKVLKLNKQDIEITSHLDSGLYYIFNQSTDLWVNSVALFDYDVDGLQYYRVDISRNKSPETISVIQEDYSNEFSLAKFAGSSLDMDQAFARISEAEVKKAYISAVFLTGMGFSDKWMKKATNILCQGRRVFAGQNIYTKGACYRAVGGEYKEFYDRFFVDTRENVLFDVGIDLGVEDGKLQPIVNGGKQWYNTKGNIKVILDDTDKIVLVYKDIVHGEITKEIIKLQGLPKRPNKTTKLSIEVEFENPTEGAVIIKDVGFGKLYPTTNKIYRKEFSL